MSVTPSPLEQYDVCMDLHRKGEVTQSLEILHQITQDFPQFSLAHNALAAFYKQQGRIDDAIESMKAYCSLEPNDSFGFSVLSAYYMVSEQRVQAEEALHRANEIRFQAQFG